MGTSGRLIRRVQPFHIPANGDAGRRSAGSGTMPRSRPPSATKRIRSAKKRILREPNRPPCWCSSSLRQDRGLGKQARDPKNSPVLVWRAGFPVSSHSISAVVWGTKIWRTVKVYVTLAPLHDDRCLQDHGDLHFRRVPARGKSPVAAVFCNTALAAKFHWIDSF